MCVIMQVTIVPRTDARLGMTHYALQDRKLHSQDEVSAHYNSSPLNLLPPPRRLCFCRTLFVCLSVCLSVCEQDNSKSYGRIFLKFWGNVGHGINYKWFNFGGDLAGILDSGSLWNFRYHCVKWGIREPLAKWIWWRHLANSIVLAEVPAGYDCFLVFIFFLTCEQIWVYSLCQIFLASVQLCKHISQYGMLTLLCWLDYIYITPASYWSSSMHSNTGLRPKPRWHVLDAFYQWCLRCLLRITWKDHISNIEVCEFTGPRQPTFSETISEQRLSKKAHRSYIFFRFSSWLSVERR